MTGPITALSLALLTAFTAPVSAQSVRTGKLDAALSARALEPRGASRVILRTVDGHAAQGLIKAAGGVAGRYFPWMGGQVAEVPDASLAWLASQAEVSAISLDRAVSGSMERTAAAIGARWVSENLGLDGTGVGVATIDSGISPWHDDLEGVRIVSFEDFVNFQASPYDDYGHGTHVAGIIAGSGHDSGGRRRGVAPGANLIVLKALDATGNGFTSNVIAAIDYAIAHRAAYNIRVINLSVAAGVYESYTTDPLTLAARRAVDAGIVVVAAAGNRGRGPTGRTQYGGIASPGNAPWVLTIGAAHTKATVDRRDDEVAAFSSRGPAAIDQTAKPDLLAPGVGIESTTDPGTALFAAHPFSRVWGSVSTASQPYLSLTGTSMAAPVVTGTIALMLQANPSLTPNAVKAILEYTAETRADVDHLTQGAGFLNARGAVQLSSTLAGKRWPSTLASDPIPWSRHVIWGKNRVGGGFLTSYANALAMGVAWGAARTPDGEPISLGTTCSPADPECDDEAWMAPCDAGAADCDPSRAATREADVLAAALHCGTQGCDIAFGAFLETSVEAVGFVGASSVGGFDPLVVEGPVVVEEWLRRGWMTGPSRR
jgi:serine protease AprX